MSQYVFKSIKDPDNNYDISNITFEIDTESRNALVEEFIKFLEASGYCVEDLEEWIS